MRAAWILPCLSLLLAAQEPLSLNAPIRRVRLHPDEAWVTRVGETRLGSAGTHRIQIQGLLPGLRVEDLQVAARGPEGTRLGDLSLASDLRVVTETPEWKQLEAEQEALRERRDTLEAQGEAAQQELAFLKGLQAAYDKELSARLAFTPPNAAQVLELGRSLQVRMADLLGAERKRKRDLEKLAREEQRIRAEMQKRSQERRTAPGRVTVELTTTAPGLVEVELSYRTGRARWKPLYEARLSEDRKRLDLALLAAVTQNTGEPWNGVRLEISNARPSRSLSVPAYSGGQVVSWQKEMPPPPPPAPPAAGFMAFAPSQQTTDSRGGSAASNQMLLEVASPAPAAAAESTSTMIEEASGLAATFLVEGLKEVPSDGEPHRFRIQAREVQPRMTLLTTPRLEATAFLLARFTGPSNLPLFPGAPVVRYAGSQRLGEAPLALPTAGQPFALGFGPYKALRVTFRRVDRMEEEIGTFTKERQWTLRDRIELTNDAAEPLEVEVQDRILKAGNDSVKVSLLPDFAPGWAETLPGVRSWKLTLGPKESRSLELPCTLRAPREGLVVGLEEDED